MFEVPLKIKHLGRSVRADLVGTDEVRALKDHLTKSEEKFSLRFCSTL